MLIISDLLTWPLSVTGITALFARGGADQYLYGFFVWTSRSSETAKSF